MSCHCCSLLIEAIHPNLRLVHRSCSYTLLHQLNRGEMEPISTVVTVVEAFKEVYLLARFVYKTAQSASHFKEEEKSLLKGFEDELLHLRSFWVIFTRADGKLIEDDPLNEVSRHYYGAQIPTREIIDRSLIQTGIAATHQRSCRKTSYPLHRIYKTGCAT